MDNNWSDAVERLIGNELLPCPICGSSPDINYEGNFFGRDLYSVSCFHSHINNYIGYAPLMTSLSNEFSECIRRWNDISAGYFKSMKNITIPDIIATTTENQEDFHDSFTKFLRSD